MFPNGIVALWLAALLTLAPGADARGRLEPVREFEEDVPESAGDALVWTSPRGVVMVADDRARVRHRFRPGGRCFATDTTRFGEALVGCSTTGYTNRRTGCSRSYDGMDDPEFDLDGPRLRIAPGGIYTVAHEGRRWLTERMRAGREQLWLHAGRRRRLVATCPERCWGEQLEPGRVTYVSGPDLEAGILYDLNLRSGRTRSWRVPKRWWSELGAMRVGATLLMVSETRDGWRLWRTARPS